MEIEKGCYPFHIDSQQTNGKEVTPYESPAENVATIPDNIIFSLDGKPLGAITNLVELWLKSPQFGRVIASLGDELHKSFDAVWEKPCDKKGHPLCLRKEDPPVIRKIETIRVLGKCEFEISEFSLKHGVIGGVRVSWGSGTFMGKDAFLMTSENESGKKRLSIITKGWRLEDPKEDC